MTPNPRRAGLALGLVLGLHSAAARAGWKTELSASASLDSAYDDNVLNGRGPDYVNRITPRFAFAAGDKQTTIEAAYSLAYWTYALGKADNSLNHRGNVRLEWNATRRLNLQLADEIVRAEDPGFLTRIGVVAPQVGLIDNVADAFVGYWLTRRLYGTIGYTYHHTSFDSFSAAQAAMFPALFDGDDHLANSTLTYKVTRLDDLLLDGRAQVFTAGPQNTSSSEWLIGAAYSPTAGWRHRFVRQLEAQAQVGPIFYQRLDGSSHVPAAPDSGATWRLGARLRWYTPTWRASLSYTRDLLGATGLGSALWADYVYAQASYQGESRFSASLGAGYFRNGRAVDQPVAYDGVSVDAVVDWRVVDNFRLGAYYSVRWQRTGPGAVPAGGAAAPIPDITRNIVGVRLLAVIGAEAHPVRRGAHE
jgi:hypothetical protein